MRVTFIAACLLLAGLSEPAAAQYRNDSNRRAGQECWNARAQQFEAVRPGERQDDLDLNRCHYAVEASRSRRRDEARECWNPRAGRYEAVRPGERQDDLDLQRCR